MVEQLRNDLELVNKYILRLSNEISLIRKGSFDVSLHLLLENPPVPKELERICASCNFPAKPVLPPPEKSAVMTPKITSVISQAKSPAVTSDSHESITLKKPDLEESKRTTRRSDPLPKEQPLEQPKTAPLSSELSAANPTRKRRLDVSEDTAAPSTKKIATQEGVHTRSGNSNAVVSPKQTPQVSSPDGGVATRRSSRRG